MSWQSSPPSSTSTAVVRERTFSDLIAGERAQKEAALSVIAEFRKILFSIAQRLDGVRVQELLREDPSVFQAFTPAQWLAFFDQVISNGISWNGSGTGAPNDGEVKRLKCDLEKEQLYSNNLQHQLDEANQKLVEIANNMRHLEQQADKAKRKGKREEVREPEIKLSQVPDNVAQPEWPPDSFYTKIVAEMSGWISPEVPVRFRTRVSPDETRWRRQSMALSIMARYGISTRLELDHLIGRLEGLKSRTNSLRETLDLLAEKGLAMSKAIKIQENDFETALLYMCLSEDGRALCKLLNWEPVESDWERINRLHEGERFPEHTFGILAFALHARLRGWNVEVLPQVEGPAQPDLVVIKGDQKHYVEVETGDGEKPGKWRNLADLQGSVAICALRKAHRDQLVSDCKMLNLTGVAADLETLVKERIPSIGSQSKLWLITW